MTRDEKLKRMLEGENVGPCKELVDILLEERRTLIARCDSLQSIASNGWIEAWHSGNGFMALADDDSHSTVMRCWQQSQTLKQIQTLNSIGQ